MYSEKREKKRNVINLSEKQEISGFKGLDFIEFRILKTVEFLLKNP